MFTKRSACKEESVEISNKLVVAAAMFGAAIGVSSSIKRPGAANFMFFPLTMNTEIIPDKKNSVDGVDYIIPKILLLTGTMISVLPR